MDTKEGGNTETVQNEQFSLWNFVWQHCVPKWCPTSMALLAEAERKALSKIWNLLDCKFISIFNGKYRIRTVSVAHDNSSAPLVLVHGMASGVGLWALNLERLGKNRPVHAFDLLGFGRSSRPTFSKDAAETEAEWVESIEAWRKEMGLEKMILLGHSLGGYLVTAYALRYPERLHHLVLADPWGFPERPTTEDGRPKLPVWARAIAYIISPFNPLAVVRASGPFGKGLIERFRPDITRKFSDLYDDNTVAEYIYHCNAQTPSGETAFKNISQMYGWAKHPMMHRIQNISSDLPMTVIYGSRSWVDSGIGWQIKHERANSDVTVLVMRGSGHHVYADNHKDFNDKVCSICDRVDLQMAARDIEP